ncbi:MAG: VanW family protein [Christensenellales bacterium]|nr:VanW family protein [Christensenellales bacterium]
MSYRQQGYRPQAHQMAYAGKGGRGAPRRSAPQQPSRGRKTGGRKRPRRHRPIRTFLLLVIFAFLATGGLMGYTMYREVNDVRAEGTFYPGIYVNDVSLYGASPQEAYDFLLAQAREKMANWSLTLAYGEQSWTITTDTLGMTQNLEAAIRDAVNEAHAIGREASFLDSYRTVLSLKSEEYRIYTNNIRQNEEMLDAMLMDIKNLIDVQPQNAERIFDTSRNDAIYIKDEVVGLSLDIISLKEEILRRADAMEAGVIELQPETIQPTITRAMLEGEVVRLANYSTVISTRSTEGRTANIELSCSRFNGLVIKDGERVSFNAVAGKRTVENGYQSAPEIVSGQYQDGVGGGICQTSSTLYNAVVQAGLEVVDRSNHGIPVNYLPPGADATVTDDGRHDLVFRNNTGADIYIVAKVVKENSKTICLFQIYGRPDPHGYTYELRHEITETIPIPEEPREVKDTQGTHVIYRDETELVKNGSEGYKVQSYLVTRDSAGNVVSEEAFNTSTYSAQPHTLYVGVSRREDS